MRRHGFPWYGIELVASGAGTLELAGARRPLAAGLVFTYGPTMPHAIFADAAQPPGKWFLDLAGAEVPALLAAAGLTPGSAGMVAVPAPARALFDLLIDTGRRGGPPDDALLAALARALLLALAHPSAAAATGDAAAQATHQRCRAWLDRHAAHGAGVQEAAAALGVSAAHLSRLFQRFERMSPGTYARRIRLQHAADVLVTTAQQVREVAATAGYADAFHFTRAFTREFGVAPSAFRTWARTTASSGA